MTILLESDEILVCSSRSPHIIGDIVYIGHKNDIYYNRKTQVLSLKRGRKVRGYKGVIEKSQEEAINYYTKLQYRVLLEDEVYFFFNNDREKDHLDPDIMDGSTKVLSLGELENLVRLIIPSGRGEYGFTEIEQVKEKARELVDSGHTYITHIEIRT